MFVLKVYSLPAKVERILNCKISSLFIVTTDL